MPPAPPSPLGEGPGGGVGPPLASHGESTDHGDFPMGQRRSIPGSRILITGASQGIGRALALEAARHGARVLAAARSPELLAELAAESAKAGHPLQVVVADVTSAEDRKKMADAALTHFGGLDVLVNNAGIGATGHFADAGEDRLRK